MDLETCYTKHMQPNQRMLTIITHPDCVGRTSEAVCYSLCLFVCLLVCFFVRSITQKRMIQKCSDLVEGMILGYQLI